MPRPAPKKPGPRPMVSPEIQEMCLVKKTTEGMALDDIAWWLHEEMGVHALKDPEHPDAPDRPVHRSTVWRWIYKAAKRMTKEQQLRQDVEVLVAGMELDDLQSYLYKLRSMKRLNTVEQVFAFIEVALKIRKEKSATYGVYVRRKDVTHHGEVNVKGLDPHTEQLLEGLERVVEEGRDGRR